MTTSETSIHPYTLEVVPPGKDAKAYQWAIRRNGKLVQRSDRGAPTAVKAHQSGIAQIEKLLAGSDR